MPTIPQFALTIVALIALAGTSAPARGQDGGEAAESAPTLTPGTIAYDRSMWLGLLREHGRIRRIVRHNEQGLEAVTVSDDPAVAAAITDHAFAMKRRMGTGAGVRRWDPVFRDLFDHHELMHIEVNTLSNGVSISETGATPRLAPSSGPTPSASTSSSAAALTSPPTTPRRSRWMRRCLRMN